MLKKSTEKNLIINKVKRQGQRSREKVKVKRKDRGRRPHLQGISSLDPLLKPHMHVVLGIDNFTINTKNASEFIQMRFLIKVLG